MLRPVRTDAPPDLIEVGEAVQHCRVDPADAETVAIVTALAKAATDHLDGWSGILCRALVTQTWEQSFGRFCDKLRLPLDPVQSITSVTYYDASNEQQTLAASVYQLLTDHSGPYVSLKPGQSWPSTYSREDAVTVEFVCGYGAPADVPPAIKQAVLMLISHWNENREAAGPDGLSAIPFGVSVLLQPYRRLTI